MYVYVYVSIYTYTHIYCIYTLKIGASCNATESGSIKLMASLLDDVTVLLNVINTIFCSNTNSNDLRHEPVGSGGVMQVLVHLDHSHYWS